MDYNYIFMWIPGLAAMIAVIFMAYIIINVTHKEMPKGEIKRTHIRGEGRTVTLTESRYDELLRNETLLEALQQSGVDNWTGYGEAMDLYHQWTDEDKTQDVPE